MQKRSKGKRGQMLTVQEFRASFGEEQQCGEQLSRQRWPDGFGCPRCGGPSRGYMSVRQVHECAGCGYQWSVTAGALFFQNRAPPARWVLGAYPIKHDNKRKSALPPATAGVGRSPEACRELC